MQELQQRDGEIQRKGGGRVRMDMEMKSERKRKRQEINKKMGSDRDCLFVFPTEAT